MTCPGGAKIYKNLILISDSNLLNIEQVDKIILLESAFLGVSRGRRPAVERGKKIVLLSHCILNVNAKVAGLANYKSGLIDLMQALLNGGYGLIQLPCVEMDMCGVNRWGQVKSQLDHPHFRSRCRELLEPIIYQVEDYYNNGYEIAAVIGIDGSPTCGVNYVAEGNWSGEIGEEYGLEAKLASLRSDTTAGIMMEVLMQMLDEIGVSCPFYAVDEHTPEASCQQIIEAMQ